MRIERISGAILILLSGVLLLMAAYRDTGFAPLTDVRVTSVEKIT